MVCDLRSKGRERAVNICAPKTQINAAVCSCDVVFGRVRQQSQCDMQIQSTILRAVRAVIEVEVVCSLSSFGHKEKGDIWMVMTQNSAV